MQNKTIQVVIKDEELDKVEPQYIELYIVNKLKEGGIPIKGLLYFEGLYHGNIHQYREPIESLTLYEWTP